MHSIPLRFTAETLLRTMPDLAAPLPYPINFRKIDLEVAQPGKAGSLCHVIYHPLASVRKESSVMSEWRSTLIETSYN